MYWRMTGCKEYDSEGRNEEVVEADLLRSVDIRGLVKMGQRMYRIFCKLDDLACVAEVFLN